MNNTYQQYKKQKYDKQQYIADQNNTKKQLHKLYTDFLTKKQLKDIITITCQAQSVHKHYSLNNLILAYCQYPEQQRNNYQGILNSFINWNKQQVSILKGSKGLKILVPIFLNKEKKNITDDTITIEKLRYFKLGSVFDISQTTAWDDYKRDLQEKDKKVYDNYEIDFDKVYAMVSLNFNGEIIQDYKPIECKGSYSPVSNNITLHEKTSHTLLHEFSHYLINRKLGINVADITYAKNEILAEISTYTIMNRIDSKVKYNFNYSNLWSSQITSEFEIKEFEKYYKLLNTTIDKLQHISN